MPPPPSRQARERERVREAAAFCADSLSDGWKEAVADRITDYAGSAWERLKRSNHRHNCKALARIARSILQAKTRIHNLVGHVTGWAAKKIGAGDAAQAFADELASKIPLPTDAKMIAVARGVQVAGILLCVMDNRDMNRCECFIDLALAETKEQLQRILTAAMTDWTVLHASLRRRCVRTYRDRVPRPRISVPYGQYGDLEQHSSSRISAPCGEL